MSQPTYYIPLAAAVFAVEQAGLVAQGIRFGGSTPAEVIHALRVIPVRFPPDLVDLSKVVATLHSFRSVNLITGANAGLAKAESAIKSSRVMRPGATPQS